MRSRWALAFVVVLVLLFAGVPGVSFAQGGDYYIYGNLPYIRPGLVAVYSGTSLAGSGYLVVSEIYQVIGSTEKGPDIRVITYGRAASSDSGMITQDYTTGSPWREGLFWIDPARLRRLKQGDIITYAQNEYQVAYVGSDEDEVKRLLPMSALPEGYVHALKPIFVVLMGARQEQNGERTGQAIVFDRDRGLMLYRKDFSTQNGSAVTTRVVLSGFNYDFRSHTITWRGRAPIVGGGELMGYYFSMGSSEVAKFIYFSGNVYDGYGGVQYSFGYVNQAMQATISVFYVKGHLGQDIEITQMDSSGNIVDREQTTGWPIPWVSPEHLGDETITVEGVEFHLRGEEDVGGRTAVVYETSDPDVPLPVLAYDKASGYLIGGTFSGYSELQLSITTPNWLNILDIVVTSGASEHVITLRIGDKTIYVDGRELQMDVVPQIIPRWGRTVVPVRFVAEGFGATVGWDGKERKVTIEKGDTTIYLWIDKPQAQVNGRWVWIDSTNHDVRPVIIDNRTMVPLRFVAESLGVKVGWNGIFKEIYLIEEWR